MLGQIDVVLSVDDFVRDGYVRLQGAFPASVAAECREHLWDQIPESADDPRTWQRPVVRLGYQSSEPFAAAINTPALTAAFDALVGPARWMPRTDVGTFAIRFPSAEEPGDDGWHIDSSFPPPDAAAVGDPFAWRVNVASRGRALLLLMLFSNVGGDDAPTRLRRGSHREVARLLAPCGDDGLTTLEISQAAAEATAGHPIDFAVGDAGDVYLCHPFLIHAAQRQSSGHPRFLAQPPLHPVGWINTSFDIRDGTSPLETSIRLALT